MQPCPCGRDISRWRTGSRGHCAELVAWEVAARRAPQHRGGGLEKGRASWAEGPQPRPSFACAQSREFPHFFPSASSRTFCRVTFVPTQGGATAAAAKCHRSAPLPAGVLGANPPAWGLAGPWAAQGMARTLPSTLTALVRCGASRQNPPQPCVSPGSPSWQHPAGRGARWCWLCGAWWQPPARMGSSGDAQHLSASGPQRRGEEPPGLKGNGGQPGEAAQEIEL